MDIGDPAAVDAICAQVADAEGLNLVGLMAIPPVAADPDAAFAALAAEHRRVLGNHPGRRSCRPGCPQTWKRRCDTVQRVCVSVRRLWDNVLLTSP